MTDETVLTTIDSGYGSHIGPLEVSKESGGLIRSHARVRDYVTESINTGKALYASYQKPGLVKTAIKVQEAATASKNALTGIFRSFRR